MPAPITEEQNREAREALLDAAEALFYERGIQAVGMDQVRLASGLPLKRIYRLFPTKEDLVVAVLRRRDRRWRGSLSARVDPVHDPRERVLTVFDWLADWFTEPGFRGCAWINAFGELGSSSEAVLAEVRSHKQAFRGQIAGWVGAAAGGPGAGAPAAGLRGDAGRADAAGPAGVAESVFLLAEGAMVTAGVTGDPAAARHARTAAAALLGTL
jgi:AcrR family transcriptional regulator